MREDKREIKDKIDHEYTGTHSDTPTNVGTTNVGNDKHLNDKRRKI